VSDLAQSFDIKYGSLLYKRGYLFSQTEVEPPIQTWIKKVVGDHYIYFDADNPWGFAQEGNSWVALIGRAVDTIHWSLDINFIARTCVDRLILSEERLLDYIDFLSGRFVLIYHHCSRTKLMTDAFGTRSAFYSLENPVMVASHYKIISQYKDLSECKRMEAIRHDPRWNSHSARAYPGNLTPIKGVYILTPNTLINLEEQKIQRFYPRRNLPAGSLDKVVEEVSDMLKRQIDLLHSNYKLAISLSAGMDSRATLAAARDKVRDVLFFTYGEVPPTSESYFDLRTTKVDALVAMDIARFFGLNHIFLENIAVESDEDFRDFNRLLSCNTYYVYGRNLAKAYLEQLPSNLLHIRSNISEIGRAFYQKAGFKLPLTPSEMARIWKHMENNELAIQAFREFAEVTGFKSILNYDPYDMFYWEHRMGTWHSLIILESDVAFDTHVLFNCRALAEKMLSVPIDKRIQSETHRNIIQTLWPQLLHWPIDEPPFRLQIESLQAEKEKLKAEAAESERLEKEKTGQLLASTNRIEKLQSRIEEIESADRNIRSRMRGLEEEQEKFKNRVHSLEEEGRELRNRIVTFQGNYTRQLHSLRNSPRYLIGDAIANAADDPRKFVVLPLKLWHIYRDYSYRQKYLSGQANPVQSKTADSRQSAVNLLEVKISPPRRPGSTQEARILFMPTNGAGLGHVTRLLAIARRMKTETRVKEIAFLTTSEGLSIFRQEGIAAYHYPSLDRLGKKITPKEWDIGLYSILTTIIKNHRINVFVFDGVSPAAGVRKVLQEDKRLRKVWVKRGMLKEGVEKRVESMEQLFHLQIIPGELGQKSVTQDSIRRIIVPPIVFLDRNELLPRKEVINKLELDPAKKTVFIQLGAGNINDTLTPAEIIIDTLQQFNNIQIVYAESIITNNILKLPIKARIIRDYPLSQYYNGFDLAISAAGYNTVAELTYFCIPSIFVPNLDAVSDDQNARATLAETLGTGLLASPLSVAGLKENLLILLDDNKNMEFRERSFAQFNLNGANIAVKMLIDFLFQGE
jgi:predicted glycosyltransferase